MNLIKINKEAQKQLIELSKEKDIFLEGNILKIIDAGESQEFKSYVEEAIKKDKDSRAKRLDITKQIQDQNKELVDIKKKLEISLKEAEKARADAEQDLDVIRKKTQYELIRQIVVVALFLVVGVCLISTGMYVFSIITGKETELIGNIWSSMFGIILTNSFSIIGTIMGIKYVSGGGKRTDG
jgi:hypothetical protein